MSHEAIVAGYAHESDPEDSWSRPGDAWHRPEGSEVLAGVQVVCECGVIILEAPGDDLGFLPLSDVNHAVRAHQESA